VVYLAFVISTSYYQLDVVERYPAYMNAVSAAHSGFQLTN